MTLDQVPSALQRVPGGVYRVAVCGALAFHLPSSSERTLRQRPAGTRRTADSPRKRENGFCVTL